MLQSRSHFADKENAHSTLLHHKTPARLGARDDNLEGSKTAGRLTAGGKMGGGEMDDLKLTMTTRTGKGKGKMQGGGGGKGGGEEEGIGQFKRRTKGKEGVFDGLKVFRRLGEPKRLFTNLATKSSNPGMVKKSLPTSKSLTFHSSLDFKDVTNAASSSSSLAPAGQKTPFAKKTAVSSAGRLKTPGPSVVAPPPMATPLPSATRARRRSKQMHTPLPSAGMAMSTPESKGGMAADLSFEMEDGGLESMLALGEVQEGVEFDDEAEIEYMAPTAYMEPFSLPYEVTSAKALGEHIRSLPPLVLWPTDDEDALSPEIKLDEAACFGLEGERPDWTVRLKSIDSDDEFDLGLPKKAKITPKASSTVTPTPTPAAVPRRAPILTNGVRATASSSSASRQPITAARKPSVPSTSNARPLSKLTPSTSARVSAATSSRLTTAFAPRKGLSTTKPSSLSSRLPSSTSNTNIKSSASVPSSNTVVKPSGVSTTLSKPSSLPSTTMSTIQRPITTKLTSSTTTSRPTTTAPRSNVAAPRSTISLRAPVPRDLSAERKRREDEAKEILRGLDEFESGLELGVGLVGDDVAFEIEE